jgi:hypothetical protein
MGTRGRVVIYYKRRLVTMWNHYDSYPSSLGIAICNAIKEMLALWGIDGIRERFLKAKVIEFEDSHKEINCHELKTCFEKGTFVNDDCSDIEWVYTIDLDGMSLASNCSYSDEEDSYKFFGFENLDAAIKEYKEM